MSHLSARKFFRIGRLQDLQVGYTPAEMRHILVARFLELSKFSDKLLVFSCLSHDHYPALTARKFTIKG